MCVCNLSYPACNAHAPFCHLWPYPVLHSFSILFPKWKNFRKKLRDTKCVCIFSTTFVWNIYNFKKNWATCCHRCISGFMQSTRCSCQILMKLEFSGQIFEKYSNTKFNENPLSESWVVPCGRAYRQTDRETDMTKLIVDFRNYVTAPKMVEINRGVRQSVRYHHLLYMRTSVERLWQSKWPPSE